MTEPKIYYLISWVEYKFLRGRLSEFNLYSDIIDQHPVEFLIEARQAANYGVRVGLISWDELDVSGAQAVAWKKKLENAN